jgi:hypothetical protein
MTMIKRAMAPAVITTALALASLAHGDVVRSGSLQVKFSGAIIPNKLPRQGSAPIKVSVGTNIIPQKGKVGPQLRRLEIAINRNGVLDPTGLPVCPLNVLQPSTTSDALRNCRRSLVGEGLFEAKVLLKGQASFPSKGKLYAFNSRMHGRPAILAHVYGTQPAPVSFTLVFEVRRTKGTLGTVLAANFPDVTSGSGYVTGLSMTLGKDFSFHGRRQSYFSASCPAPDGVPRVSFPFARASLSFKGGKQVSHTLTRTCRARG